MESLAKTVQEDHPCDSFAAVQQQRTHMFSIHKNQTHIICIIIKYTVYMTATVKISVYDSHRFFFLSCSHIFFSTIDSYLLFSLFLIFALSCRVGMQQWPFRCQTHLFQFLALLLLFRLLSVAFHQCKTHRAFDWYGDSEKCI